MHYHPALLRFQEDQQQVRLPAGAASQARRPLSPWRWDIFPQLQGLAFSATSRHYALANARQADAYAHHPVLGLRLVQLSQQLLALAGHDATRLLGTPDDAKLRSSMTLFASFPDADPVFQRVLDRFFQGRPDEHTLHLLRLPV